jgi:plasmid maintenance system antidote protein VapI
MATNDKLNLLIENATAIAGNQSRLAEAMGIPRSHITQMKQGKRPASWKTRGKLRAIAGEEPGRAFLIEMAQDLEQSEHEDEKKAAESLAAILAAFPKDDDWRKR